MGGTMLTKGVQLWCGAVAVIAFAYTLYHVFPIFLMAGFVVALLFGYAWLNRKVDR